MVERTGIVPVMSAKVALLASWNATRCDDDTEKNEPDDGNDLNDRENEFGLTIAADAEEVDSDNQSPEDDHECGRADIFGTWPKRHGDRRSCEFQWECHKPVEGVAETQVSLVQFSNGLK